MNKKKNPILKETKIINPINFWDSNYFHYFILFVGCWLLYGWTKNFDFNLDDDYILYHLRTIDNTADGFFSLFSQWYAKSDYRPITMVSFWIERFLFNDISASTAHIINVLIFSILLIAIYKLIYISKFLKDDTQLKLLALFTALFFLVHPNHVSVVANIKSRDNLLSMLFGVLAAIQLIKLYDLKQYWRIIFFLVLITLALLSKLDAYSLIIFPALVILLFRDVDRKKIIKIAISTFVLFIIAFQIFNIFKSQLNYDYYHMTFSSSENPLYNNDTILNRISLAFTSIFYYLKFLIVPFDYHFYFGYNQIPLTPLFSFINILTFIVLLFLFGISIYLFSKNKIYLFCLLFFGIAISYAINLITSIAGIVMDRYNFIASLSFCLFLATIILTFKKDNLFSISNFFALILICIYVGFTVYRTSAWKDSFTLFDRDIPHLANSVNANRIAGGTYIHLALDEEMKPNYNKTLTDSFITKGERYAITASKVNDKSSQVWELIGLCDLYRKNNELALDKFKKCFAVDTSYLSGINYLGFTYWNLGNIDSAYYYFNFVINREPYFNYSANNMVNMLIKNNRKNEADSILSSLSKRFPNDERLSNKIKEVNSSKSTFFN